MNRKSVASAKTKTAKAQAKKPEPAVKVRAPREPKPTASNLYAKCQEFPDHAWGWKELSWFLEKHPDSDKAIVADALKHLLENNDVENVYKLASVFSDAFLSLDLSRANVLRFLSRGPYFGLNREPYAKTLFPWVEKQIRLILEAGDDGTKHNFRDCCSSRTSGEIVAAWCDVIDFSQFTDILATSKSHVPITLKILREKQGESNKVAFTPEQLTIFIPLLIETADVQLCRTAFHIWGLETPQMLPVIEILARTSILYNEMLQKVTKETPVAVLDMFEQTLLKTRGLAAMAFFANKIQSFRPIDALKAHMVKLLTPTPEQMVEDCIEAGSIPMYVVSNMPVGCGIFNDANCTILPMQFNCRC